MSENGIKEYNFKSANQDQLKKAFAATDWDRVIGDKSKIEEANQNFVSAIIAADETAKVPKFKISNQQQQQHNNKQSKNTTD